MAAHSSESEILISRISSIDVIGFDEMLAESEQQGFAVMRRLLDDWQSGRNTFSNLGGHSNPANEGHLKTGQW